MMDESAVVADNSLLASLPQAEWSRLKPCLQTVVLTARTTLYDRGQVLDHVHFVQRGYVSLIVGFGDGFQVEVGGVGSNGMLGVPLVLGATTDAATAMVQTTTVALRMPAGALAGCMGQMPALRGRLLRYAEMTLACSMQLAACNAHHSLHARLARCLLSIQDHIRSDAVPLTHESLASLLCAHRPSVSVAIKQMERAGLLRATTRSLLVADRPGLEAVACECRTTLRSDHGSQHDKPNA